MIRAHILVIGRVQAVFFRKNTQKKAIEFHLTGWVRNLFSGKVEIMCEGEKEDIEKLLEWLKDGPRFAKVKDITVEYMEHKGDFDEFRIKEYSLGS